MTQDPGAVLAKEKVDVFLILMILLPKRVFIMDCHRRVFHNEKQALRVASSYCWGGEMAQSEVLAL